MKFYEDTISYKLITLLEEFSVLKKYRNLLLYIFHLCKFHLSTKMKINKLSKDEQIHLLFTLFKERFYLNRLLNEYGVEPTGKLKYNIINDIIICEMLYGSTIFNIEYDAIYNKYCMYINNAIRNFNIINQNLLDERKYSIFKILLKLIFEDIELLLWKIFLETVKRRYRNV